MPIKKQDFYEGAALYQLARAGGILGVRYEAPFFLLNHRILVLLKYCTKGRSPWGFTFTADEQEALQAKAPDFNTTIGLICGADGIVGLNHDAYVQVAAIRQSAVHIACYRRHGQHYEIKGPDGTLDRKVAPLNWQRILEGDNGGGANEAP